MHAQLLERSTALSEGAGGGSLTALPIVETTEGDISSYLPTNLISITDGQVYLDAGLFERNLRPAIDVARSVSRVGGAAQPAILRIASLNLRIQWSRLESLEALTRVGLEVDPATRTAVERGRIVRELLRQPRYTFRSIGSQIVALTAVSRGWLDGLDPEDAAALAWSAVSAARAEMPAEMRALDDGRALEDAWTEGLAAIVHRLRTAT